MGNHVVVEEIIYDQNFMHLKLIMKSSSQKKSQARLSMMAVAFEIVVTSRIQQIYNSIRTSASCYNCSDKRGVPEEGVSHDDNVPYYVDFGSSLSIRGQKDINDNDIPDVEFSSTRGYFIVKT